MKPASRPERGFQKDEYIQRTRNAQEKMRVLGFEGILLSTEQEVRYFTGFHTSFWQSPTRPWFVFIPIEGKPVAVIPEIGAELMRRSWLDDIRTWSAPMPKDDGISLLTELLEPLSRKGQTLGVPKGHETLIRMPLGDWERLISRLPGLVVKDATSLTQGLRMVKSEAEIEKIRYICSVGSAAFAEIPKIVNLGMPLDEVFKQFRLAAISLGADDAPYVVGGADQGGYADVISPPSNRRLKTGDILMLDTGCSWDGYFCDFDRNWSVGPANDLAKRAYEVLWRATDAGINAARPGNACHDIHAAMSKVISELDSSGGDIGRLGHGLGMQLTEQPSHTVFDDTIIESGMVLTIEPSLSYGDGLMMVHEENIVVTPNGPELLTTRATPDLIVINH